MKNRELLTQTYDYHLPKKQIAIKPLYPSDSAKLLVYDRRDDTITHTTFKKLLDFIPDSCDIFLNDTKVIKARIFGHKEMIDNQGGGKIELLFNKPIDSYNFMVYIRGKVTIGMKIIFDNNLIATIKEIKDNGYRVVTFTHDNIPLIFEDLVVILEKIGHIPLPPYIQREDYSQDEVDYQTLFASNIGAVASPTASLHFTPTLLDKLMRKNSTHKLTLHIGAGTFKSVDVDDILSHEMHSEYFDIPNSSAKVIDSDRDILAIGTTVTRTIEYYIRTKKLNGECDLFLNITSKPKRVTHLLTNFHLPKSTLIMLVSSFIGVDKTMKIYKEAIKENYRFFSYGDGMLII